MIFEPALWFQEHSSKKLKMSADPFGKKLVTSADLFGEAYARKELVEEVMFPDQVSNPSLSDYDINVTTVVIQEVVGTHRCVGKPWTRSAAPTNRLLLVGAMCKRHKIKLQGGSQGRDFFWESSPS